MKIEEIFGTFPRLETERLILRKITIEDIEDMFEYGSNEEVTKYVTWEPHQTLADTNAFIEFALNQYEKNVIALLRLGELSIKKTEN